MIDAELDELINELTRLRIHRVESTAALQRIIEDTGRREARLIQRIQRARAAPAKGEVPRPATNSLSIGDTVRITNRLRDKLGTTGVVIHVGPRMVTLRNNSKTYKRAWWNLEKIEDVRPQ